MIYQLNSYNPFDSNNSEIQFVYNIFSWIR